MCLRCGSALYPDAKFCAECGSPVPASPAADEPPPAPEENIATTEAVLAWEPACPVPGYPSEMRFKKTWRPYQARVLGELAGHLEDRRLHLVAAPGSGKTVLGIEVARQLNQPTLILSPTLAIRDQWIERLTSDFLSDSGATPAWISTDVRRPEFLTVATYQLLHSACGGMVTDDGSEEDETQTEDLDGFETDGDQEAPDAHSGRDRYGVPALLNRLGF